MAAHEADRFPSINDADLDASLSHLNQWIIDCVEKCQDAIFIEGQGDVCSININN
jgi:hypothetical protein